MARPVDARWRGAFLPITGRGDRRETNGVKAMPSKLEKALADAFMFAAFKGSTTMLARLNLAGFDTPPDIQCISVNDQQELAEITAESPYGEAVIALVREMLLQMTGMSSHWVDRVLNQPTENDDG